MEISGNFKKILIVALRDSYDPKAEIQIRDPRLLKHPQILCEKKDKIKSETKVELEVCVLLRR